MTGPQAKLLAAINRTTMNPVVNVLLSAVLNGEPLFRWQYLAALVFVCVGIWLVNKAPAKKEEQ